MIRCMAGSFNMVRSWWRHSSEDPVFTPDSVRRLRWTFRCVGPTSNGYCRKLTCSSGRMIRCMTIGLSGAWKFFLQLSNGYSGDLYHNVTTWKILPLLLPEKYFHCYYLKNTTIMLLPEKTRWNKQQQNYIELIIQYNTLNSAIAQFNSSFRHIWQ